MPLKKNLTISFNLYESITTNPTKPKYLPSMNLTGFVLLIVGLGLTLVTTFKYFTNDHMIDLGSVEITKNRPHYLTWSPLVGLLIMGAGGIMLLKNNKK